jgi:hypothetical protein
MAKAARIVMLRVLHVKIQLVQVRLLVQRVKMQQILKSTTVLVAKTQNNLN